MKERTFEDFSLKNCELSKFVLMEDSFYEQKA